MLVCFIILSFFCAFVGFIYFFDVFGLPIDLENKIYLRTSFTKNRETFIALS